MKYTQTVVLVLGVIAAILGIYAAEKAPYTDIAAVAVIIAAVVGVAQAFQAAKEADFVKQILSHLARSTPASPWWRTRVRELVQSHASASGYRLDHIVYDARDPDEPDANAIFVFASQAAPGDRAGGVLVLTPAEYAELYHSVLRRSSRARSRP